MSTTSTNKEKPAKKQETPEMRENLIAVIRVRGLTGIRRDIKDTLNMLCLYKKNFCTVRQATPSIRGMLKKVKDYVTYGEIMPEVYTLLKKKNEKKHEGKKSKVNAPVKKSGTEFFRLNSPKKGYGRKGVKQPFSKQGALGYRGDNINDLIKRMI